MFNKIYKIPAIKASYEFDEADAFSYAGTKNKVKCGNHPLNYFNEKRSGIK